MCEGVCGCVYVCVCEKKDIQLLIHMYLSAFYMYIYFVYWTYAINYRINYSVLLVL